MFNRKYKILNEDYVASDGTVLHPIQALKNFSNVKKGDRGGYIEKYSNLSQKGNCWVYGNAKVYGDSTIEDYAIVEDDAIVIGSAISNDSIISGNAKVVDSDIKGDSYITNESRITNYIILDCEVRDNAIVESKAKRFRSILRNCNICDDAKILYNEYNCIDGCNLQSGAVVKRMTDFAIINALGNSYTVYRDNKSNEIRIVMYDKAGMEYYYISAEDEDALNYIALSLDSSLFGEDNDKLRKCSKKLLHGLIAIGKTVTTSKCDKE